MGGLAPSGSPTRRYTISTRNGMVPSRGSTHFRTSTTWYTPGAGGASSPDAAHSASQLKLRERQASAATASRSRVAAEIHKETTQSVLMVEVPEPKYLIPLKSDPERVAVRSDEYFPVAGGEVKPEGT
jgi:hypothetical protein